MSPIQIIIGSGFLVNRISFSDQSFKDPYPRFEAGFGLSGISKRFRFLIPAATHLVLAQWLLAAAGFRFPWVGHVVNFGSVFRNPKTNRKHFPSVAACLTKPKHSRQNVSPENKANQKQKQKKPRPPELGFALLTRSLSLSLYGHLQGPSVSPNSPFESCSVPLRSSTGSSHGFPCPSKASLLLLLAFAFFW